MTVIPFLKGEGMLKWIFCVVVSVNLLTQNWIPNDFEIGMIVDKVERCRKSNVAERCELNVQKILRDDGGYHYNFICRKEQSAY